MHKLFGRSDQHSSILLWGKTTKKLLLLLHDCMSTGLRENNDIASYNGVGHDACCA